MSSAFTLRGPQPQLALQAGDLRLGVACGEAALQLLGDAGRQPSGAAAAPPDRKAPPRARTAAVNAAAVPAIRIRRLHPTSASG